MVGLASAWLGPWTAVDARVMLESELSVQEMYIDNLFFTDSNEQEDFGTIIAPSLDLTYLSRNLTLGGQYTGIVQLFTNNPGENTYAQRANLIFDLPGLTQRYRGLEVALIESFNFTPQLEAFAFGGEPGEEAVLTAPGVGQTLPAQLGGQAALPQQSVFIRNPSLSNQGILTRRTDAFQNVAGFSLRYAWTPTLTPTTSYRNRVLFFSSDFFRDSISHLGDAGLDYQWRRNTSLRVTYRYQVTDFIGDTEGDDPDGFVVHSALVGGRHQFSRTLAVFADVGVLTVSSSSEPQFSGNLGLAKLYQRGTINLRLNQSVTQGGGLTTAPTLTQSATGSIDHRFTQRITGFWLAGVARNESLDTNVIDAMTYQTGAGVNVRLLNWLAANLTYSYLTQVNEGTLPIDGQRNVVLLGLTATAPPWKLMD